MTTPNDDRYQELGFERDVEDTDPAALLLDLTAGTRVGPDPVAGGTFAFYQDETGAIAIVLDIKTGPDDLLGVKRIVAPRAAVRALNAFMRGVGKMSGIRFGGR